MNNWKNTATQCLQDEAQAILGLIPQIDGNFEAAVDIILQCMGKVIITGVGKSGHIGAKIAATFSSTGTPSLYINPLDLFHGDLGLIQQGDVVIAISNSGQTDELLRIIPNLQERNIPIIGISGNKDSLLAKYAQSHLLVSVEKEATPLGLAPTSSTTAQLAMGDALACCLIKARGFGDADFALYHPGGSLGKRLLTRAKDVMIKENLPVISPDTKMSEAIILISKGRLGICVAVDGEKVVGIVTDGDLRRAMENSQGRFFELSVGEVMTRHPKTVGLNERISDINNLMNRMKIHCVLVVDEAHRLLGVVDSFSAAI